MPPTTPPSTRPWRQRDRGRCHHPGCSGPPVGAPPGGGAPSGPRGPGGPDGGPGGPGGEGGPGGGPGGTDGPDAGGGPDGTGSSSVGACSSTEGHGGPALPAGRSPAAVPSPGCDPSVPLGSTASCPVGDGSVTVRMVPRSSSMVG